MFEFECKGLEINNIGKLRCEEENAVSRAQRSGPLLLVIYNNYNKWLQIQPLFLLLFSQN